jgi:cephalosporin-C deacetylase-like acetyl esterase
LDDVIGHLCLALSRGNGGGSGGGTAVACRAHSAAQDAAVAAFPVFSQGRGVIENKHSTAGD